MVGQNHSPTTPYIEERTEYLLLRRAFGRAQAEDYVGWAVQCLSCGRVIRHDP